MEWISVKDRKPEKGQQVLVRGWLGTDLTERDEEVDVTIGLVNWDSPDYSECSDTCHYSMWYSGITHWSPVAFELEAEQEVQGE
jgi:hypothetical protein